MVTQLLRDARMVRKFWIPLFVSFIAFHLLGGLFVRLTQIIGGQFAAPIIGNIITLITLGYLIPYGIIVAFALLKYRNDLMTRFAIIAGPILFSVLLLIAVLFGFLLAPPLFTPRP